MAQYELIDSYLGTLRHKVRWRDDADDLIAEAADHLLTEMEKIDDKSVHTQRSALQRFGDPDVLAEAFASTINGGIAVPTKFTKLAGVAGLITAAIWPPLAIAWALGVDAEWPYFLFVATLVCAGIFASGVYARHGGALGAIGRAGIVVFYIGLPLSLAFWTYGLWMGIQGAGLLLVGYAAYHAGVLPRLPTIFFATAYAAGAVTFGVGRYLELGEPDVWGDYQGVNDATILVGGLLFAVAAYLLGKWLAAEEPADIPPSDALMV